MAIFLNGQNITGPETLFLRQDFKASVRAATTGNITLSGLQTIDTVSVVSGDRVLVKNQTAGVENGVYVVASGAWARAVDFDQNEEVTSGATVFVEEGGANNGSGFSLITPDPIIVGTTAMTFVKSFGSTLVPHGPTHVETGSDPVPNATITVGGLMSAVDKVKLDGVEIGATADQTAGEIKTAYESNANTNAYTDAEKAKLGGIEANAKDDQNALEVVYDNTSSGLSAVSVQAAVDEVEARVDVNDAKVSAGGLVTIHSDMSSAGSGAVITTAERAALPTTAQKAALVGTGTPGSGDLYVNDSDVRMTDARTPLAHKATHVSGGSDPFVTGDILEAASRAIRISLRNDSGSAFSKGDLVAVTGFNVTEGRPTVELADKDLANFRPVIAVVEASVPNNTNFEGLVVGLLTGLDTSSFVVNAQLVLGDDGAVSTPPPDTDPFTGEVQLIGSVVRSDVSNGSIYFSLSSTLLPMTAAQFFWTKESASTGHVAGGDVTRVSGLDVAVALGEGFVNTGGTLFRVTWDAVANLSLTASDTSHIFVDSAGVVQTSTSLPSSESNIVLATAITDGTDIDFLSNHKVVLEESASRLHQYVQDVIGPIVVSGIITSKDAIALRLEVEAGTFYTRDFRVTVPATDPITFTYWHRDGSGGFTRLTGQTTIDPENFDDGSGTLAAITAGKYKKDLLFVAPTSFGVVEYHIFYGQEEFDTQSAAEAGNLPAADSDVLDNSIRSGGIVVLKSAAVIASVVDVRPLLGQLSPGTTAVTDHSLLSGLGEDSHPVYLPADGSRAMTGALDMGTSNITNVGTVDGVDVSAHAARHTNGSDDIQSATASQKGLATSTQIAKLDGIEVNAKDDQSAAEVPYSNTTSGLTATDVQAAIDEVEGRVDTNDAKVSADGVVTTHSDISSAGSGAIITTAERANLPTTDENDALSGTGTPSSSDRYVNESDGRIQRRSMQLIISGDMAVQTFPLTAMVPDWLQGQAGTITLVTVRGLVDTAPVDATLRVDVLKNSSSVYSTDGNKINILTATNTDDANTIATATAAANDEYQLEVEQIGSTTAGADLTVKLEFDVVVT